MRWLRNVIAKTSANTERMTWATPEPRYTAPDIDPGRMTQTCVKRSIKATTNTASARSAAMPVIRASLCAFVVPRPPLAMAQMSAASRNGRSSSGISCSVMAQYSRQFAWSIIGSSASGTSRSRNHRAQTDCRMFHCQHRARFVLRQDTIMEGSYVHPTTNVSRYLEQLLLVLHSPKQHQS